MEEVFKRLKGTKYFISNFGRCHHERTPNRFREYSRSKTKPYLYFKLFINEDNYTGKMFRVDYLVANLFVDNPNGYKYLSHKDGNPENNIYTNLEWVERCDYGKDLEGEIWKPVVGFEGFYEVSNLGRVLSLERVRENNGSVYECRILKPRKDGHGYYRYMLMRNDGKGHFIPLHRILAKAFIPNPENKPTIDHIDGCITNNSLSNLRWATMKENVNNPNTLIHKAPLMSGSKNPMAKKVVSVSLEDGSIKSYDCMKDACAYLGVKHERYIGLCCAGKWDSYKGHKWYYKEDYERI